MTDAPTEILPPAGAPLPAGSCRTCSAPFAADQRYCLGCGARVGAPRVDWAATLAGPGAGAPAAPAGGAGGGRWAHTLDRVGGPMGAAAVVLIALAVGFLLGQGGSAGGGGPATIIQRPPVVNVQGGGTAATAGDASGADASGAAAGDAGAGSKGGGKGGGSTAGIPKADAQDGAGGDLDRLRAQPDQQATGGDAPRTDDKPSGGGTDAETIG